MDEQIITLKHCSENGRDDYRKSLMSEEDVLALQKRVDAGELENVCCGNGYHSDILIGHAIPMKWK